MGRSGGCIDAPSPDGPDKFIMESHTSSNANNAHASFTAATDPIDILLPEANRVRATWKGLNMVHTTAGAKLLVAATINACPKQARGPSNHSPATCQCNRCIAS